MGVRGLPFVPCHRRAFAGVEEVADDRGEGVAVAFEDAEALGEFTFDDAEAFIRNAGVDYLDLAIGAGLGQRVVNGLDESL